MASDEQIRAGLEARKRYLDNNYRDSYPREMVAAIIDAAEAPLKRAARIANHALKFYALQEHQGGGFDHGNFANHALTELRPFIESEGKDAQR